MRVREHALAAFQGRAGAQPQPLQNRFARRTNPRRERGGFCREEALATRESTNGAPTWHQLVVWSPDQSLILHPPPTDLRSPRGHRPMPSP